MTHGHGHDHPPVKGVAALADFPAVSRSIKDIAIVVNRMNRGGISCTTHLTLNANTTTTTMTDERLSEGSFVDFDPLTANAAVEKANGTLYALEANRNNKSWVITHANNAQTDRTFVVAIIG